MAPKTCGAVTMFSARLIWSSLNRRPKWLPHQRSIPMPSVQQELGKYVSVRVRKDGTARVLFEVPARLRPSHWPSTRPLPIEGRRGDLSDAAEVARIQNDARRLYAELMSARTGAPKVDPNARSFTTLVEAWKSSQAWKDNKPRTNKGYEECLREIKAWETANNPDPAALTVPDIEAFIGIYDLSLIHI